MCESGIEEWVRVVSRHVREWYPEPMREYLQRSVDGLLRSLMDEHPALLVVGPRAAGKTTTAIRHAATVVRLDDPAAAAAFRADPDAALRGLVEPVLLDEWQIVPEVLGAIKRSVDVDPHPGRFLVTGSVRGELESATWPGTGRLIRVPLYGLTVREREGRLPGVPLIDRVARGDPLEVPEDPPDLRGYVELALAGGFPESVLASSDDARRRWLEGYVEQLVTRDASEVAPRRDPTRLRRFLEAYTLASAGVVDDTTLIEASGVNRKTANAYEHLLADLFVVDAIPAWTSNRLKRLVRAPKRYLVDPGLVAGVLKADTQAVLRDGDLLGRVIDTFVVSQIRAELSISETRPRLFHLRTPEGRHEVDLVVELGGGDIVAIEVKAHSAPKRDAARHIIWLRDQLGDRFVAGVVLHTGPRTFELDRGIVAAPISTLWAPHPGDDAQRVSTLLEDLPGARERAQLGLDQAREGRTTPIDEL